jgi:hypothetical protein
MAHSTEAGKVMKQLLHAKRTLGLAFLATTLALGPAPVAHAVGGAGAAILPGGPRPGVFDRGLAAAKEAVVAPFRRATALPGATWNGLKNYGRNVRAAWHTGETPAAGAPHAGDYDVPASHASRRGWGATASSERRRAEYTEAHTRQGGAYESFATTDAHREPTRNTTMSALELAISRGWIPADYEPQILERCQNSPDPAAARTAVRSYLEATRDAALVKIRTDFKTTLAALPLHALVARHQAEIAFRRNRAACMAFFGSATREWVANASSSGYVNMRGHGLIKAMDRQLQAPANAAATAAATTKSATRWAPGAGLRRTFVAGMTLATAGLVFAVLSPLTLPAMAGMAVTLQFAPLLAAMGGVGGAAWYGGLTLASGWAANRLARAFSDARLESLQNKAERDALAATASARLTRQALKEGAAPPALNDAAAPSLLPATSTAAQDVAAGTQAGKKQGLLSRFVGSMFGRSPAPQLAAQ